MVYGAATIGLLWRFVKLDGSTLFIPDVASPDDVLSTTLTRSSRGGDDP